MNDGVRRRCADGGSHLASKAPQVADRVIVSNAVPHLDDLDVAAERRNEKRRMVADARRSLAWGEDDHSAREHGFIVGSLATLTGFVRG